MANVEKVSIALTPDMMALVRDAIASGEYASSSEVIRDALRDWKTKRALHAIGIEELRRLAAEGVASGSRPWVGAETLMAEVKSRAIDRS